MWRMDNANSPIASIVQWWREWRESDAAGLRDCGDDTVERIAHEAGLTTRELRQLARKGSHAADLLPSRMAALDLDPTEVGRFEPQVMQDMQRVCSMCESHGRCQRDLSRNPNDPIWKQYCPNVSTLAALDNQPWASRREA